MPSMKMSALRAKYESFTMPIAEVIINEKEMNTTQLGIAVGDMHIELTSSYEASMATFRIYGVYDKDEGFDYESVKDYAVMGRSLEIKLGYHKKLETVFVGYICGVDFAFDGQGMPYIGITGMDAKGVLMGGTYANHIDAENYYIAVKKVLDRHDNKLISNHGLKDIQIDQTPDSKGQDQGGQKSSPLSMEMVSESDYEFIVRAAKRYNYEFFIDRGTLLFREAKKDHEVHITLGPDALMKFRIGYSITSAVEGVEARAMNPSNGKLITHKLQVEKNISTQADAGEIVGKGVKVYVDPSITSDKEAEARALSLAEKIRYRLGSIDAETVGIPDLVPGQFIKIENMGQPADNDFYITKVTHDFTQDAGFKTRFEGCAGEIKKNKGG